PSSTVFPYTTLFRSVLQGTTGTGVWIYNPTLNTITAAASARNQNEACWVKLTNDCVLTIDAFGMQSEHYVPSLNSWVSDANVPVDRKSTRLNSSHLG